MNKAELIAQVAELEATIALAESDKVQLDKDLRNAQKELADINKPVITEETLTLIYEAVEEAVGFLSLDDPDLFEAEFSINYDNRVELDSINLIDQTVIAQDITESISHLFNVIERCND